MTVVQFWQQERDVYTQQVTAAQSDMLAAQTELSAAKAALTSHTATFAAIGAEIQAARAELATTAVPADASALNTHIRDLLVEQHTLQGDVLDAQDAVASAQTDFDAATGVLTRANARVADANAKLAQAQDAEQQRQAVIATLSTPPYDSLQADANALLAGAAKTNADTAIAAAIPAELVAIATLRATRRAQEVADRHESVALAESALGDSLGTDGGLDGAAAKAAVGYVQALRRVDDYATSAKTRLDKARAVLSALEVVALHPGSAVPLVTAAQKAELTDAGALAARQTAESHAVGIDTDRQTVANAQKTLDADIIAAIKYDVDIARADTTVSGARAAVEAAQTTLETDQDTFAAGDKATLDDWQVIVADGTWQTLLDYITALADITALKDVKILPAGDADSLLKLAADAELAYGDALAAAAKARRRADALADQVALRQQRLDAAETAYTARALSAVRGDSF